jgi:competence CoiA-like predicted nuclease
LLTCKVGETIINCFDGKYDKHKLKEWSDKSKLICPDCGNPYEYCHGRIIPPYFRHKEKEEYGGIYSESETEEHIKGKLLCIIGF